MTDRRITRRQALLVGGSAVLATAFGVGGTRALVGGRDAPALVARTDFEGLVGTSLRASGPGARATRLELTEVFDLRHARPGSPEAFGLTFRGASDLPWRTDVIELRDHRDRAAALLVARSALPADDGSQQFSAIINRTIPDQEV